MARKQFSFQECFNDLNGKLSGFVQKSGLPEWDAEDVVQNVWFNVFKRLNQDQELLHRFESEPDYANNYIFKAVINGIINERKQITKRKINSQEPHKEPRTEFEDPIEINQRSEAVQKLFKEFKNELKDDENQFMDLWNEVAEQNISVNISEVARLMGLTAAQGHDIFRRIKRKALAFKAKNNLLKDVAAPAAIFEIGIFDFIKDSFRPDVILDKKYQKSGERISNKVLAELGADAISIFSKFVK